MLKKNIIDYIVMIFKTGCIFIFWWFRIKIYIFRWKLRQTPSLVNKSHMCSNQVFTFLSSFLDCLWNLTLKTSHCNYLSHTTVSFEETTNWVASKSGIPIKCTVFAKFNCWFQYKFQIIYQIQSLLIPNDLKCENIISFYSVLEPANCLVWSSEIWVLYHLSRFTD